jgi:hypothetical protein
MGGAAAIQTTLMVGRGRMKIDVAQADGLLSRPISATLPTRIITYAWGEKYVGELLSLTLPAALAPGNLPYVASVAPCEMVLLTQEKYFSRVNNDPAVARIRAHCPVRLIALDDLIIAPDKYGMTLTYALHRGFADLGPAVTDSWLIFFNADFIIADGSLYSLVSRLAAGERLVAAPSYCTNAVNVLPMLRGRIDPQNGTLSLPHRELAALVLRHRHNTIRAKTVNQSLFSIRHMDQFYWEVDSDTLLGHQMPVAIVGMRPERYLPEPNSQWDHGLMKEFVPNAAPYVIGDSDEFLMLELRDEVIAEDQLRLGRAEPAEIARNTRSFMTAYQRDMGKHALTLHACDLPANVATARQSLRDYMDRVLAHLPPVLPAHLDHPQWNYHQSGFIKGRHDYLSKRLGRATEEFEAPESFSELDRLWWNLDGLNKSYARRRAELIELRDHQLSVLLELEEGHTRRQRSELARTLVAELSKVPIDETGVNCETAFSNLLNPVAANNAHDIAGNPFASLLSAHAEAWKGLDKRPQARRRATARALEWMEANYKQRLAALEFEYQSLTRPLQSEYDRLADRGATSAAVPDISITRGPRSTTAKVVGKNLPDGFLRRFYLRVFGVIPRVTKLHPYWAPLRHFIRLVDRSARERAGNILVVSGKSGIADRIADALPGLHSEVSLVDMLQGNLMTAFNHAQEIEVCICALDADEVCKFSELIKAVAPCLCAGGKIIVFHPNFELNPVAPLAGELMRGFSNISAVTRIYYSGSPKSAQVLRRFHLVIAAAKVEGLRRRLRAAVALLLLVPRAVAANRYEGLIPESQASELPDVCTSLTIEMTVQNGNFVR